MVIAFTQDIKKAVFDKKIAAINFAPVPQAIAFLSFYFFMTLS